MEVEFDYRREPSGLFGRIGRPVARVIVAHGAREIPEIFYVDSGADLTLVPRSVGELLGFPPPRPNMITEIRGLGVKGIPIVVKRVSMRVGSFKFAARIGWCLIEEVPPLLGRVDVFRLFDILFARNRKTIFSKVT